MKAKRYHRSLLEQHPAYAVEPPSPALRARTVEANWPPELLERVLGLRHDRAELDVWLDTGFPTIEMIEDWVATEEALVDATLNIRAATWGDSALISDLCQHAPEQVGDWQVIVERGPNAFAQFRLQEHGYLIVAEDQRVGLGVVSHSARNTVIDGKRTSVHMLSGWRVRDGFRGLGLSKLLMQAAGPGTAWFGLVTYWYVRLGNAGRSWVTKVTKDMAERPEGWGVTAEQLTASITHFQDPTQGSPTTSARPATPSDLPRCLELINRTHDGLDLFRPYTLDYLSQRLDDPAWGPKPDFYPPVYGWDDFRVVEIDGEIVACGGLWDRGRDVRERWTNPSTGEEHVVASTALLDFGFATGHEAAMADLIRHFLATTAELERGSLMAPLEFLPEVVEACGALDHAPELRELHTTPFVSPTLIVEANISRPYTDLAYW